MTRERLPNTPRRKLADPAHRYVTAVLARESLREVATLLSEQGIPVMPLKGVLFQLLLYPDPAERALTDVDVLVPERDFDRAVRILLEAGFIQGRAGRSLIECTLKSPWGMNVDLHRRLFSRGRFRLSTQAVFRRATRDEALLGVPLYIPHPHDTAAHLIGKFVCDHEFHDSRERLTELSKWVAHSSIQSGRLLRHLRACGMSRAARYTFRRGVELSGDPFYRAALVELPSDPLGAAYAKLAGATIPRLNGSRWGALPAHLLNESLVRAGASLALSAVDRVRHAWFARQNRVGLRLLAPKTCEPDLALARGKNPVF